MVNNQSIIIYKLWYKKGRRQGYDIYQRNRPTVLKKVVNIFDLGYLEVEKDFHEQKSYIPKRNKINQELSKNNLQQKSF